MGLCEHPHVGTDGFNRCANSSCSFTGTRTNVIQVPSCDFQFRFAKKMSNAPNETRTEDDIMFRGGGRVGSIWMLARAPARPAEYADGLELADAQGPALVSGLASGSRKGSQNRSPLGLENMGSFEPLI